MTDKDLTRNVPTPGVKQNDPLAELAKLFDVSLAKKELAVASESNSSSELEPLDLPFLDEEFEASVEEHLDKNLSGYHQSQNQQNAAANIQSDNRQREGKNNTSYNQEQNFYNPELSEQDETSFYHPDGTVYPASSQDEGSLRTHRQDEEYDAALDKNLSPSRHQSNVNRPPNTSSANVTSRFDTIDDALSDTSQTSRRHTIESGGDAKTFGEESIDLNWYDDLDSFQVQSNTGAINRPQREENQSIGQDFAYGEDFDDPFADYMPPQSTDEDGGFWPPVERRSDALHTSTTEAAPSQRHIPRQNFVETDNVQISPDDEQASQSARRAIEGQSVQQPLQGFDEDFLAQVYDDFADHDVSREHGLSRVATDADQAFPFEGKESTASRISTTAPDMPLHNSRKTGNAEEELSTPIFSYAEHSEKPYTEPNSYPPSMPTETAIPSNSSQSRHATIRNETNYRVIDAPQDYVASSDFARNDPNWNSQGYYGGHEYRAEPSRYNVVSDETIGLGESGPRSVNEEKSSRNIRNRQQQLDSVDDFAHRASFETGRQGQHNDLARDTVSVAQPNSVANPYAKDSVADNYSNGTPEVDTLKFDDERLQTIDHFDLPPINYATENNKDEFTSFEYEFDDVFNVGQTPKQRSAQAEQDVFFDEARQMADYPSGGDNRADNTPFGEPANDIHYNGDMQLGWRGSETTSMPYSSANSKKKRRTVLTTIIGIVILCAVTGFYIVHRNHTKNAPAVIRADSTPYKVPAETGAVQQQNNLDVDAYNSAAGQPEESNQQTLIDRSETPESVDALGGQNAQSNEKSAMADNSNIENAISSARSQVVPTRIVPSVTVNADGEVVLPESEQEVDTKEKESNDKAKGNQNSREASASFDRTNSASVTSDAATSTSDVISQQIAAAKDVTPQNDRPSVQQQRAVSAQPPKEVGLTKPQAAAQAAASTTKAGKDTTSAHSAMPQSTQETTHNKSNSPQSSPTQPTISGGFYVQVASNPTQALAQAAMAKAKREFAPIIGNLPVNIQPAEIPGKGTYYRVRIHVADKSAAATICERIKQSGGSCFVAH